MGYLLVVVLAWGLSWYAITLQLGQVHPMASITWRFFIAGVVLLLWLVARGRFVTPKRSDALRLMALGLLLFCFNFICFYIATGFVTSGLISVVFAAAVFITVFNQWIWSRVVPARRTLIGAAFGICGIAFLFAPAIFETLTSRDTQGENRVLLGLALSVLGTWFFSVGNLISASLSRTNHLPSIIACAMLIGSATSAAITLALGQSLFFPFHATYLFALGYLAIGASVIGFVAYLTLVANHGADKAGYATILFPVVALAVSTALEGYEWSVASAMGIMMATVGAVIVFYQKPAT